MIQRMIEKSKNLAKNVGRSMEVVIARLTLAENKLFVVNVVITRGIMMTSQTWISPLPDLNKLNDHLSIASFQGIA